jgi:hypothetical protein
LTARINLGANRPNLEVLLTASGLSRPQSGEKGAA